MFRNVKVGTRLLALVVAPLMVLAPVAFVSTFDRLDEAAAADQVENSARLTALSDATVRSLSAERLLTAASIAGDEGVALDEARAATDASVDRLEPALSSNDLPSEFDDRLRQAEQRIGEIVAVRASVDANDAAVEVVLDAYGLAIDELIRLEAEMAAATSAAAPSLALGDASVLSRAQEARGELAALGAVTTGAGVFQLGDLERFTELHDEEERLLDRFTDGATSASATELRDTMASPEVVVADAQVDELISSATIGGAGVPQIGLTDWVSGQTAWLDAVGAMDSDLVQSVSVAAAVSAESATKAARLYMLGGAGATLFSFVLALRVARSINRPLRRLTEAAHGLAADRLPLLVENMRSSSADPIDPEAIEPIEVTSGDEIGQLAEAFNTIQQVMLHVAEEQSTLLRKGIGDIFVNLARRNQSLLDRQIEFIDKLEADEQDPDQLENLFRLDHLATRMRRNAESLLVLAGAETTRRRAKPVALSDVVRVAIGEVEDFTRVSLVDLDDAVVAGNLGVDLSHLLSELMENATHFSPPETAVEVGGQFGSTGAYVITVTDHGIGMSGDDLSQANLLLADPPLVGLALGRSLGFTVVGRIAERLGLRVQLNASPAGGVTAVIELPSDLVSRPDEPAPLDPLIDQSSATSLAPVEAAPPPPARSDDSPPPVTSDAPPLFADSVPTPATPPAPSADPTVGIPADPEALGAAAPHTELFQPDSIDQHGQPPEAPAGVVAESTSLPSRGPVPDQPTGQLSEALPGGEDFEQGLASLIGPESSDEDIEHQFWGSLADEDPPKPLVPDPAPIPAPDPTRNEIPVRAPEPDAGGNGLVRRVPGAAATPAPVISPSVSAPRRSPEQVRAMLSRYRQGRQSLGAPIDDDSTTEDI